MSSREQMEAGGETGKQAKLKAAILVAALAALGAVAWFTHLIPH